MDQTKVIDVLYIEDDESDVFIAKKALSDIGCDNVRLQVAADGEEAIKYLNGPESQKSDGKPDLVLLDLNLPKVSGKEVLKTMKASTHLRSIPVLILSTSKKQQDVDESYMLGAAGYFAKPIDYSNYQTTFRSICDYWSKHVVLPSKK